MSIKRKLLILFLAFTAIPMGLVGSAGYYFAQKTIEKNSIAQLGVIADLKVEIIETVFENLKSRMAIAQDYYNIKKNLPLVAGYLDDREAPEYLQAERMLDGQLKAWKKVREVVDFMLVGPDGRIAYAMSERHKNEDLGAPLPDPGNRAFEEGKKGIYYGEIFRNRAEDGRFGMLLTAPVRSGDEKELLGVIAIEVDMAPIYRMIQDTSGLGDTGETLIGKKVDGQALFLNPLRHDGEAALERTVSFGSGQAYPIQEAVSGRGGQGLSLDYRGEEIIAAWRYMPLLGWGIVAKIDASEAFAPVNRIRGITITVAVLALIMCVMAAYALASTISGPILELQKGTEIVGRGDLEYRVGSDRKDELGQLSRAFDCMAESLKKTTASRNELERSNEELQQFAYVASHDLQEPLRMVSSYTQLIAKRYKGKLDEDADEFIGFAVDGANRMQRLIQDLLTYSRVDRGGRSFETTDMGEVMEQAKSNLQAAIEESGAVIKNGKLPEVRGDRTQLVQLFQNLMGNAIKFRGERPPEIDVSSETGGKDITFSLSDNGIGIEPDYFARIFIIFQRLHRREYAGTGIGLALCRKIVERHGGRIWLESEPGKGSTFYFTLPAG